MTPKRKGPDLPEQLGEGCSPLQCLDSGSLPERACAFTAASSPGQSTRLISGRCRVQTSGSGQDLGGRAASPRGAVGWLNLTKKSRLKKFGSRNVEC